MLAFLVICPTLKFLFTEVAAGLLGMKLCSNSTHQCFQPNAEGRAQLAGLASE